MINLDNGNLKSTANYALAKACFPITDPSRRYTFNMLYYNQGGGAS